jgi:hypothetical protein
MRKKSAKGARKKPTGRPPVVDPSLDAALTDVLGGVPIQEAAEKHKLSPGRTRTLYRRAGAAGGPKASPSTPPPPASPSAAPVASPTGSEAPAIVAPPPDPMAIVRRILGKRDPAALAELEGGLAVATRGEVELAAWLDRPIERGESVDPIDALARALDAATMHVEKLPPLHPRAATMLGAVATLGAKLENVAKGRPKVPTRDEVTERIEARREEAVRKILQYTGEAAAELAKGRADLAAWAAQELGARQATELERRVNAMLGQREGPRESVVATAQANSLRA